MRNGAKAAFVVGVAAALSIAAGSQLTGGGGLTRVVLSSSSANIASGSGTSANPLLVALTTGTGLSGTGSAGSPLTASGGGGATVTTSAPIQGTGSAGAPVTLASSSYGDVTVTGGTTWSVNALPESRITNLTTDLAAKALASTTITTTAPLTIDGTTSANLSTGRTLAVGAFGTSTSGVVSASGAASSFLRGDNTWSTPTNVVTALGLAAIATSGSASDLASGTVPAGRMPALTGDVTSSSGTVATSIASHAVTNGQLAQMATLTIKGNASGGTADASDLSVSQVISLLGIRLGDFGDGSDGACTMDGTNSCTCTTHSGTTYTAARSCFFSTLTINAGSTFKPDGWPIYVRTSTVNNGDFNSNGGDASNSTNGTGAIAGGRLLPGNLSIGNASTVAPQTFVVSTAANNGAIGSGGGAGGNPGSTGTVGRGGGGAAGGNATPSGNADPGTTSPSVSTLSPDANGDARAKQQAITGKNTAGTQFSLGTAGGTGGLGGGAGGGNLGGAGASGGWVVLSTFTASGTGTYRAKGGKGGNGGAASGTSGGGGGGGGGAGGVFVLIVGSGAAPTPDVSGGAGGTGGSGAGGGGAGATGGTGGSGSALVL